MKIGDYVVMSNCGLCRVDSRHLMNATLTEKPSWYFLLVPLSNEAMSVYVPEGSEPNGYRGVMTKSAAEEVLLEIEEILPIEVDSERRRETVYKEALHSLEPRKVVALMKLIYSRTMERIDRGKSMTILDDRYGKMAEDVFLREMEFVLSVPYGELKKKIADSVRKRT